MKVYVSCQYVFLLSTKGMDFFFSSETTRIASIIVSLYFLYYILLQYIAKQNPKQPKTAPVAAGARPIIGHLHLLGGSKLAHIVLGSMAENYGPIFTIKLGVHKALVVSDWKTAKECYTTNDKVFLNRPKAMAVELMGYNYAIFGLGPYGPYWYQMRKIVVREFLSNSRIEMFGHLRVSELKQSMKDINELWLQNKSATNHKIKVDMKQWFGSLTLNMVLRMLVGKRFPWNNTEGSQCLKSLRKFIELVGTSVVGDAIPYLRWLDFGGYEKDMKKSAKELDSILDGWLKEHKGRRSLKDEQHDFMDVMLSTLDGASPEDFRGFDNDTIIKSTCLALLSGAADTTMVTLTWALCLLLNNRDVLKKARDELNTHVGRDRQVEESDIKNLAYFQAIIKESLRLYPAGQLLPPRESLEDCVVGGYYIPKGTRLLVNLFKVHRDPQVWPNPNEFKPERFLTSHKDVDIMGKNYELMPFGSGRRICPGISLALRFMQLALASLIHGFEFETPSDEPIDMNATVGLSNSKASSFEVLLKPRLSFQD